MEKHFLFFIFYVFKKYIKIFLNNKIIFFEFLKIKTKTFYKFSETRKF